MPTSAFIKSCTFELPQFSERQSTRWFTLCRLRHGTGILRVDRSCAFSGPSPARTIRACRSLLWFGHNRKPMVSRRTRQVSGKKHAHAQFSDEETARIHSWQTPAPIHFFVIGSEAKSSFPSTDDRYGCRRRQAETPARRLTLAAKYQSREMSGCATVTGKRREGSRQYAKRAADPSTGK